MLIVVSYDVREDRRRTRLAHTLKDFGRRVQYSVFECLLEDKQLAKLRLRVVELIDPAEDSVRIYRLCAGCVERIELIGQGMKTEDADIFVL